MGDWWNPFDDEEGHGFNGGWVKDINPFGEGKIMGPPHPVSDDAIGAPVERGNFIYPGTTRNPDGTLTYGLDAYNRQTQDIGNRYGQELLGMGQGLYGAGGTLAGMGAGALGADSDRLTYDPTLGAVERDVAGIDRAGEALMGLSQASGPSAAEALLRGGVADAQAQNLALAVSGRGLGGGAAARRRAMLNNAALAGRMNPELAALRASENQQDLQRRGQAAAAAATARGQAAQANLGLGGYVSGARGQAEGLATDRGLGLIGQGVGAMGTGGQLVGTGGQTQLSGQELVGRANESQMNAQIENERNKTTRRGQDRALQGAEMDAAAKAKGGAMGLVGMAGAALFASDRAAKTDIEPVEIRSESALDAEQREKTKPTQAEQFRDEMLAQMTEGARRNSTYEDPIYPSIPSSDDAMQAVRATPAFAFKYKDPEKHGAGQRVGVMAQDLERTPAGRRAVSRTAEGLRAVDGNELTSINTAALHGVDKRVGSLEDEIRRMREQFGFQPPAPDTAALDSAYARERAAR